MAVVLVRPFRAGFTEILRVVSDQRSSSRYGDDLDRIRSYDLLRPGPGLERPT